MTQPPNAAVRPMPDPTPMTQFFWDGANAHKLLIQRCNECGHHIHLPRPVCNRCLSTDLTPAEMSGKAILDTWTIPMQPIDPYFIEHMPYVYAVVELPEEPNLKMVSNIIHCAEEHLTRGMALDVVFEEAAPDYTVPLFQPADPALRTQ